MNLQKYWSTTSKPPYIFSEECSVHITKKDGARCKENASGMNYTVVTGTVRREKK